MNKNLQSEKDKALAQYKAAYESHSKFLYIDSYVIDILENEFRITNTNKYLMAEPMTDIIMQKDVLKAENIIELLQKFFQNDTFNTHRIYELTEYGKESVSVNIVKISDNEYNIIYKSPKEEETYPINKNNLIHILHTISVQMQ
jgi:hypothetical protein